MNRKIDMQSYLPSAIETIYRKDDDLIILGLTGRTGSGCSSVAQLLCSEANEIQLSLFSGATPASNEQRKDKIILRHFQCTWKPFQLIQVRSIITLLLLEQKIEEVAQYLEGELGIMPDKFLPKLNEMTQSLTESINAGEREYVSYVTGRLRTDCEEMRELLGEGRFVQLYQLIGKNLRLSGSPIDGRQLHGKFFTLAEKVNSVVKSIIATNKKSFRSTLIVIDAIRSPLEAIFFQDRYASFYLAAVSCADAERRQRLIALGYSADKIALIDKEEYSARDLDDAATFSVQDIQGCLQRSDLYISNPQQDDLVSRFAVLANQVVRFVSLMKHPGLVAPTHVERCMQLAYTAKLNSGCISRQVGAAITDKNFSIQAIGWNDVPYGQVPCNLRDREDHLKGSDRSAFSEYERTDKNFIARMQAKQARYIPIKKTGRTASYCFKDEYNDLTGKKNQVHTRSLHAEENAFLQISKYGGRGIQGGMLFTTASPCELCSKKAYQLGISRIIYIDPYPGIAVSHILHGGVHNPELILFSGAIGRAFHRLYTPVLPYKDEMEALTSGTREGVSPQT